jgi:AraC family transcriptional regulator
MRSAVERAIDTMWQRYGEPISLEDLADAAILSRFYFSRVFRTMTGTSPGRFLAAIRLYQAKILLLESSMSVTDISYHVGYNSPGTFTSRFTRSVGMSPSRYRGLSEIGILPPVLPPADGHCRNVIRGGLVIPDTSTPVRVYVAAFSSPVPEGAPIACDVVESAGRRYRLDAVPDGVWYVRAAAVEYLDIHPCPGKRKPLFVCSCQTVTVRSGRVVEIDLPLRETSLLDLPILLALPELDSRELPTGLAAVG